MRVRVRVRVRVSVRVASLFHTQHGAPLSSPP